tara:strand:- start:511 stop:942 length:432 start_codon:yes stop_codon:yes gene_type:complete
MRLTGKTFDWDGVALPYVDIVIVNSIGVIKRPVNGVVSDINGKYSITVSPSDFLMVRSSGYLEKRVKVSDICKQNSCNFNIKMEGKASEQDNVVVVGIRKPPKKKEKDGKQPVFKTTKVVLITFGSLLLIGLITAGLLKLKNK